jgi:hypothetical protein
MAKRKISRKGKKDLSLDRDDLENAFIASTVAKVLEQVEDGDVEEIESTVRSVARLAALNMTLVDLRATVRELEDADGTDGWNEEAE